MLTKNKKTSNSQYLDKAKTVLHTPNNLYEYSLNILGTVEDTRDRDGLVSTVIGGYKVLEDRFKEALLFGRSEAAYPLAYLYSNGLGVQESQEKAILWLMIGSKLGSDRATNLLKCQDNDKLLDINKLLNEIANKDHSYLEPRALKYAAAIKVNAETYREDELLTNEYIVEASTRFDEADSGHTILILGAIDDDGNTGCSCIIL